MRSEGYSTWVCLCVCVSVCLSVKSHLSYGASVRPENAVTYSAGNEGQKICGDLPETTAFKSYAAKHERKSQYANFQGSIRKNDSVRSDVNYAWEDHVMSSVKR